VQINLNSDNIKPGTVRYSGVITILESVSDKHVRVRLLQNGLAGLREFTVLSKNNFSPGDIIKGNIISRGNNLYLSVLPKQANLSGNSSLLPASSAENNHFIEKTDILSRFLASFLDSAGKPTDNALLSILESLIYRKRIRDIFSAALAGEAYLKGFKNESAVSAFLDAVSPDHEKNQGGQEHGKKSSKKEDIKDTLSQAVADSEEDNSALFVFNHLPLPDRNWAIIPFQMDDIKGDLRLKVIENELKNLIVHVEKAAFKWFFEILALKESEKIVKIYANREGSAACEGKKFDLFKKKLHNLGVIIDDNIYDIHLFNGFSKIDAFYDVDFRI